MSKSESCTIQSIVQGQIDRHGYRLSSQQGHFAYAFVHIVNLLIYSFDNKGKQSSYDALSYTATQKTRIAKRAVAEVNSLQSKSRRSFFLLSKIAAVAACLVSVLTISAEAAGIPTPVSEILEPIFGGAVAQTKVMDKIGCPIDASDTDNGVTIRADAIIGDQYNVCILFSISRDDDTPLLLENVTVEQLHAGGVSDIRLIRSGGAPGSGMTPPEIAPLNMCISSAPMNR